MSRYKAYPEYQDSGVEWADKLPRHWGAAHLKWISTLYAGGTPSKAIEEYWENGSVPWLNSGEVNQGRITEASTYITESAYRNSSAKWIPKHALVMALAGQGKTKGMIAQLAIDATCNQSMGAIVPHSDTNARYLYWWLTSNYQNIRNMAGGDLRDGLNLELLGDIGCPTPREEEMAAIAAFLDHETAKIDALIEKQQRLIELLKEKRQAVISHAVTKGLNPKAQMKDSGVEWLGEVPAHWVSTRLKYLKGVEPNAFVDGPFGSNLKSEHFVEDGVVYVIESTFATTGQLDPAQLKKISRQHYETVKRSATRGGDIIIAKIGARYGSSSILPVLDADAVVSGNSLKLTVNDLLLSNEYANELLRVLKANDAMDDGVNVTAQPALSLGGLNNLPFLRIPLREQNEIVIYVKAQKEKFNLLIDQASAFINLAQERRTAVISAAVTGKIDVRDWQAAA